MQDDLAAGTSVVPDYAEESSSLLTLEEPTQLTAVLDRTPDGELDEAEAEAEVAGEVEEHPAVDEEDDVASTVHGDEAVDEVTEMPITSKVSELTPTTPLEKSMRRSGMTLVLDMTTDLGSANYAPTPKACPLFALVSLNPVTAPSAEVPWSKLLELSENGERETPVMTVGRDKTCDVQIRDPRVSLRHFEVVARRAGGPRRSGSKVSAQSGLSEPPSAATDNANFECFLNDFSSNGSAINSTVVGKGKSARLRSGDEICVLPEHRVGAEKAITFLFRNMAELIGQKEEVRSSPELDELVQCTICMDTLHKCVALMPCFHNFCSACYSDWMIRKADCPVCRRVVTAITRNHPMDGIVEAFLQAAPNRRRPEAELLEMDERDRLKLKPGGKLIRECCSVGVSTSSGGAGEETAPGQHAGGAGGAPPAGGGGPQRPSRTGSNTAYRESEVSHRRPVSHSHESVGTSPPAPQGASSVRPSRSHACALQ